MKRKYFEFVRHHLALNKIIIMLVCGLFTTVVFANTGDNSVGLLDSVVKLFSGPAAYLLFSAGVSLGYGISQRTTVKALNERLDEYRAMSIEYNKIRNNALSEKLGDG